jgi:hypothetical protein
MQILMVTTLRLYKLRTTGTNEQEDAMYHFPFGKSRIKEPDPGELVSIQFSNQMIWATRKNSEIRERCVPVRRGKDATTRREEGGLQGTGARVGRRTDTGRAAATASISAPGRPVSAARRRWLKRRGERSGAKRGCWEPGFRASGQSRLMGARV